jgi:hypothetical protein
MKLYSCPVCGETIHEISLYRQRWVRVTDFDERAQPRDQDYYFCSEDHAGVWLRLGTSKQNKQLGKLADVYRRIKNEMTLEDLRE